MTLEPVFAAFFAVLLGGESLTAPDAGRRRAWCSRRCTSSSCSAPRDPGVRSREDPPAERSTTRSEPRPLRSGPLRRSSDPVGPLTPRVTALLRSKRRPGGGRPVRVGGAMLGDHDTIATIAVKDLQVARDFYEGVLGFAPRGDVPRRCALRRRLWCLPRVPVLVRRHQPGHGDVLPGTRRPLRRRGGRAAHRRRSTSRPSTPPASAGTTASRRWAGTPVGSGSRTPDGNDPQRRDGRDTRLTPAEEDRSGRAVSAAGPSPRRRRRRCRRRRRRGARPARTAAGPDGIQRVCPARAAAATNSAAVQPAPRHVEDDDVGLRRAAGSTHPGAASAHAAGEPARRGRGRRRAARRGGRARAARPRRGCRPGASRRRSACARSRASAISSRGPDEHRADRRAEALGQADAHGVELAAVVAQRDARWRRGRSRAGRRRGASRRRRALRARAQRLGSGRSAGPCRRRSCGCSRRTTSAVLTW